MTYREFLNDMRRLGPAKLQRAYEILQRMLDGFHELEQELRPQNESGVQGSKMTLAPSDLQLESEVIGDLKQGQPPGAIGDGTVLREVFQFVKENPLVLLLLK